MFIFEIKPSYLDTEQNIFPKAKLCLMQIELYIKQYIPNEHDVYYFDAQAIYGHLRRHTENRELRNWNPRKIQPTQTHTTTYVSTVHSRHKNADFLAILLQECKRQQMTLGKVHL